MTSPKTRSGLPGRGWAYTGAILGGLVSIAANIGHSFIVPVGAPADWQPEPGQVVSAIVWPVFLFIAVEILARIGWPNGRIWKVIRWGGMLPVTLVAGAVSYQHLSGLLAHYGEDTFVSTVGPLAVDGLMVMATAAILATGAKPRRTTLNTTTTSVTPSTTATATASPQIVPARPVPVPVVVDTPTSEPVPVRSAPAVQPPTAVVSPASDTAEPVATRAPDTVPVAPAPTAAESAATSTPAVAPSVPLGRPVPAALLSRARHTAQAHHATTGEPITAGELAVRLRIDTRDAAQILAVLNLDPTNTKPTATVNGKLVSNRR
ncbi:MAG: DUF2637 domain-containing protein [Hamadaea sp.]|uniref:DUF2637 domain-containing protein n=1 Tax=Hamadaea sp. TaxID=2024425 RepID=UPI0017A39A7D|nr:DUF2637 domain-containing protein [Hamadaea sp.]NUT23809.1 DUF2637 domain-containing protein [Hamadaea sp.]